MKRTEKDIYDDMMHYVYSLAIKKTGKVHLYKF